MLANEPTFSTPGSSDDFFFNLDVFNHILRNKPGQFFLNLTLLHYVSLSDVTYKKVVLVHMVRLGSTMSPPLPLG
jgi:hypothetical protein